MVERKARGSEHKTKAPRGWLRFNGENSTQRGIEAVRGKQLNFSLPRPWSHYSLVQSIAGRIDPPIAIVSLSEDLREPRMARGKVVFGKAEVELGAIAFQYAKMQWWVTENGLTMMALNSTLNHLSKFDSFAGKLTIDRRVEGSLQKGALLDIARALDEECFQLKCELEPAQWELIAKHNQKHAKQAIRTFEQACLHSLFIRCVRQRLCRARGRVLSAL